MLGICTWKTSLSYLYKQVNRKGTFSIYSLCNAFMGLTFLAVCCFEWWLWVVAPGRTSMQQEWDQQPPPPRLKLPQASLGWLWPHRCWILRSHLFSKLGEITKVCFVTLPSEMDLAYNRYRNHWGTLEKRCHWWHVFGFVLIKMLLDSLPPWLSLRIFLRQRSLHRNRHKQNLFFG